MELFCFVTILSMIVLSQGDGGCRDLDYLHCIINKALIGHVIKKYRVLSPGLQACQHKCFDEPRCVSYNLGPVEGHVRTCELNRIDHGTHPTEVETKEGYEYCPIKNPCLSMPCSAKEMCFPDFAWNTFSCREGDWTQWSEWSCVCPRTTRTRSCVSPFPNIVPSDCPGPAKEEKPSCPPMVDISSCSQPLGLQDGRIKDDQITASSNHHWWACSKNHARLHRKKTGSDDSSWCVKDNDKRIGVYIQIDLRSIKTVTKVATQGRDHDRRDQWVTMYTLSYSNDNTNWTDYVGDDKCTKRFVANNDKTTVVTNALPVPIKAQHIRVVVYSWHHHISMRLELYGC